MSLDTGDHKRVSVGVGSEILAISYTYFWGTWLLFVPYLLQRKITNVFIFRKHNAPLGVP